MNPDYICSTKYGFALRGQEQFFKYRKLSVDNN